MSFSSISLHPRSSTHFKPLLFIVILASVLCIGCGTTKVNIKPTPTPLALTMVTSVDGSYTIGVPTQDWVYTNRKNDPTAINAYSIYPGNVLTTGILTVFFVEPLKESASTFDFTQRTKGIVTASGMTNGTVSGSSQETVNGTVWTKVNSSYTEDNVNYSMTLFGMIHNNYPFTIRELAPAKDFTNTEQTYFRVIFNSLKFLK
jgi:hypothetical protein